ncbi:DNA-binding protein [Bosea sp. R86505]|uniref:DNA-binding protein n=1 Tax=Bosea sp. R86505 TaxID=3101710 RepID=UPI00367126F3
MSIKDNESQSFASRIEDLAAQGPLGRTHIFSLIKEGKLPARKAGRATFILRKDWEAFLEGLPVTNNGKRTS